MKLCFSTLGCPDWDITQVAQNGAAYGFDAVELRISGDRHVDPSLNPDERRKIREMFAAKGLEIAIISGYTLFCGSNPEFLNENGENLLKNARLAADLGAPYLRTFLGTDGDFSQTGAKVLRQACNQAHDMGVTVLMEIHDALKTGKMAAGLVEEIASPGFAILWDTHHGVTNNETPADTWRHAGKYIRHVHMKDADAHHNIKLMGKGSLPVKEVVETLKAGEFKGCLSLEWEKTWIPSLEEPEIALPQYLDYMRSLV